MGSEKLEENESFEPNSFQLIQDLSKNYKDADKLNTAIDIACSSDFKLMSDGAFARTIQECMQFFEKKSFIQVVKGSKVGRQLTVTYKSEAFEKKYLKDKNKIKNTVSNIINGFLLYKISQDQAVVGQIQSIHENLYGWNKRYLALNYFLALKTQINHKVQDMSKKGMELVSRYEEGGKLKEAHKVRQTMKQKILESRSKALNTNFILFLQSALPMAFGNINEYFEYQLLFTFKEFVRALRSRVEMIVEHLDDLIQQESETVESHMEQRREELMREASGGGHSRLHRDQLVKITETLNKERVELKLKLTELETQGGRVKNQVFYLHEAEKNIMLPKKPRPILEEELVFPRDTYDILNKAPDNDLNEVGVEYIENICIGVARSSCVIPLHENYKKRLNEIIVKYGSQTWPTIYATCMMDTQIMYSMKNSYEANTKHLPNDQLHQLHGEKQQLSNMCNQILQLLHSIDKQAQNTEQFRKTKFEFYIDQALILKKMIVEIYPLLGIPKNIRVKHVERGISAVKSAEKALTKVLEDDSDFEPKMSEELRNELIRSLYSISSLMILEDEEEEPSSESIST